MKKFIKGVMTWKTYACFMFTGSVCVYGAISLCMGHTMISVSILFQLLLISALGTLIQGIAFAENWVIKKAKYTTRMIIFLFPFLIMLSAFALLFKWFPTDQTLSWLIFVGIVIIVFIVMLLSFELMFKITGKKYDGLLGQYHRKHDIEE